MALKLRVLMAQGWRFDSTKTVPRKADERISHLWQPGFTSLQCDPNTDSRPFGSSLLGMAGAAIRPLTCCPSRTTAGSPGPGDTRTGPARPRSGRGASPPAPAGCAGPTPVAQRKSPLATECRQRRASKHELPMRHTLRTARLCTIQAPRQTDCPQKVGAVSIPALNPDVSTAHLELGAGIVVRADNDLPGVRGAPLQHADAARPAQGQSRHQFLGGAGRGGRVGRGPQLLKQQRMSRHTQGREAAACFDAFEHIAH